MKYMLVPSESNKLTFNQNLILSEFIYRDREKLGKPNLSEIAIEYKINRPKLSKTLKYLKKNNYIDDKLVPIHNPNDWVHRTHKSDCQWSDKYQFIQFDLIEGLTNKESIILNYIKNRNPRLGFTSALIEKETHLNQRTIKKILDSLTKNHYIKAERVSNNKKLRLTRYIISQQVINNKIIKAEPIEPMISTIESEIIPIKEPIKEPIKPMTTENITIKPIESEMTPSQIWNKHKNNQKGYKDTLEKQYELTKIELPENGINDSFQSALEIYNELYYKKRPYDNAFADWNKVKIEQYLVYEKNALSYPWLSEIANDFLNNEIYNVELFIQIRKKLNTIKNNHQWTTSDLLMLWHRFKSDLGVINIKKYILILDTFAANWNYVLEYSKENNHKPSSKLCVDRMIEQHLRK